MSIRALSNGRGAACAASLAMVVTAGSHGPLANGGYQDRDRVFYSGGIFSRASGKTLDVENRGMDDGVRVQQWDFANQPNQLWDVVDQGNGRYAILNKNSRKALDVANRDWSDGAKMQQWTFANTANQLWQLQKVDGGYYQIVSAMSGKCLDVDLDRIRENGANVQQWTCAAGQRQQQWRLGR